jgi:hypothetical protein
MDEERLHFEELEEVGLFNVRDKVEEIPIDEIENFYHDIDLTSDSDCNNND